MTDMSASGQFPTDPDAILDSPTIDSRETPSDVDAVRKAAVESIGTGDPRDLLLAHQALAGAAQLPDPDGRTHHLLGLVQFLQQDYPTRGRDPRDRDPRESGAGRLGDPVGALAAQCDRWPSHRPRPRSSMSAGWPPLPRRTCGNRWTSSHCPRRAGALRLRGTSRELAGAVASPIVGAVLRYETRHGIPQAWIEWPELKAGDIRKDLKIGGIRNWMNANTLQSTEAPGTLVDGQAPGQVKPWFADRFPTADGSWTTDDPREGAVRHAGCLAGQGPRRDDPPGSLRGPGPAQRAARCRERSWHAAANRSGPRSSTSWRSPGSSSCWRAGSAIASPRSPVRTRSGSNSPRTTHSGSATARTP